ncbi:spore germination protein [Herbivorax sp. ANBcel31]|uniref:spore germination protein n=1 Tax=Herbivorax sp. ANBcel31 TaxID=3069754 RepID=UPI0027B0CA66|nr:spore germination protein [Herbivorax sp. ANBcel31]MDQ2087282.1 spore germination protein [Herbivorax sp. ANBcel31]
MLDFIKNIFKYTEQKQTEGGWELLEDENENIDKKGLQVDLSEKDFDKIKKKSQKSTEKNNQNNSKKPLNVKEWNQAKKSEKASALLAESQIKNDIVSSNLEVNMEYLNQKFHIYESEQVIIRELNVAKKINSFVIFISGMIDNTTLNQFVIPQLMNENNFSHFSEGCPLDYISKNVISINEITKTNNFKDIISGILSGLTAFFIEECDSCLLIESRGYEKRSVESPVTESSIKGSHEGFTENLGTNLTLLRRIIKNENLTVKNIQLGTTNKSSCSLVYIKGITNTKLIKEVEKRINSVSADLALGNGFLEQYIEDRPYSIFPQILSTERPERTASFLMEGRVVVLTEGTPFSIAMPATFVDLIHTSEDFFLRWPYASFLRILRILALFISFILPGLYVALTLFHHEMIPTSLLMTIINTREEVPFPVVIEILVMEVAFELIREGGVRMPGVIGQTLGIVGALILGQAAVAAGLVSPILIIVVAMTGLSNFSIPNYLLAWALRVLRFAFILFGAVLGFYGISLGLAFVLAGLCNVKSFGVPILSPIAPKTKSSQDIFLRYPLWLKKSRPDYLNTNDKNRMSDNPRKWEGKKGD